eukprot:gene2259-14662_t
MAAGLRYNPGEGAMVQVHFLLRGQAPQGEGKEQLSGERARRRRDGRGN